MGIHRIKVSQFRNLNSVDLHLSPDVNFIFGVNGSGKTSLLEAVSTLASGRSFRTHKFKSLIAHHAQVSYLYCEYRQLGSEFKLGMERHLNGDSIFKLDGGLVNSASQLAEALPCHVINSESFRLIEAGPLERRHFLDWLVFHVKPSFKRHWSQYNQCLKQRNALLRSDKITPFDVSVWDKPLAELGVLLTDDRQEVIQLWTSRLTQIISDLGILKDHQLSIEFYPGWNATLSLDEVLREKLNRDMALGHTGAGPHRADIKILLDARPADEVLSRGQLKTLVTALYLAQFKVFCQFMSKDGLLLVDDLPAELDAGNLAILCKGLGDLPRIQVFITGIDLRAVHETWSQQSPLASKAVKMFHVKQGQINEVTDLGEMND
jgi:DNA replication and repair protein RecF